MYFLSNLFRTRPGPYWGSHRLCRQRVSTRIPHSSMLYAPPRCPIYYRVPVVEYIKKERLFHQHRDQDQPNIQIPAVAEAAEAAEALRPGPSNTSEMSDHNLEPDEIVPIETPKRTIKDRAVGLVKAFTTKYAGPEMCRIVFSDADKVRRSGLIGDYDYAFLFRVIPPLAHGQLLLPNADAKLSGG